MPYFWKLPENECRDSVQHKLENVGQVHFAITLLEFLYDEVEPLRCIFTFLTQILDGKEDALHVASSEKYRSLPSGQSTLKAFLRPCSNPPALDVGNMENGAHKKRKLTTPEEGSDYWYTFLILSEVLQKPLVPAHSWEMSLYHHSFRRKPERGLKSSARAQVNSYSSKKWYKYTAKSNSTKHTAPWRRLPDGWG